MLMLSHGVVSWLLEKKSVTEEGNDMIAMTQSLLIQSAKISKFMHCWSIIQKKSSDFTMLLIWVIDMLFLPHCLLIQCVKIVNIHTLWWPCWPIIHNETNNCQDANAMSLSTGQHWKDLWKIVAHCEWPSSHSLINKGIEILSNTWCNVNDVAILEQWHLVHNSIAKTHMCTWVANASCSCIHVLLFVYFWLWTTSLWCLIFSFLSHFFFSCFF